MQTLWQRIRDTRSMGSRPVVVFDLDSTLIHTGGRHLAIATAFAERHVAVAPALAGLRAEDFGWDVRDPLRTAGIDEGLLDELLSFWTERFFDGAWCAHDQPAAGAVSFVQAVWQQGAEVAYLTGRPEPTMGPGTRSSLTSLGFPLGEHASLHMKPTVTLSDARFKRVAIQEILQTGPIVATFENEPGHANAFLAAFPNALHVLVSEVRDPKGPTPDPRLVRVADFSLMQPR